ncbi:hypothetical protein FQZ97_716590 [compost metagenome]
MADARRGTRIDGLEHEFGVPHRIELIQNGPGNVAGRILDHFDAGFAGIAYRLSYVLAHLARQPLYRIADRRTHPLSLQDVDADILGSIQGKILRGIHGHALQHIARNRSRLIFGKLIGAQIHICAQPSDVIRPAQQSTHPRFSIPFPETADVRWRQAGVMDTQANTIEEQGDMQLSMAFNAVYGLASQHLHGRAFFFKQYFFPAVWRRHRFVTQPLPGSSGATLLNSDTSGTLT